jgi:subtilisin family serine protease
MQQLLLPLLALGALCSTAGAAAGQGAHERFDPDLWPALGASPDGFLEVVVLLRPPADRSPAAIAVQEELVLAALTEREFRLGHRFRNLAALTGSARAEALQVLALHPQVARVGLAGEGIPALDQSVPYIRADRVQTQLGITGQGVTVAVLDTGVDSDHPDLADSLVPGALHFLGNGANVGPGAEDFDGHGTNVTGIITSNGGVAPVGVAPETGVLALQVINPATGTGFLSDWAAAIDHVVSVKDQHPRLVAINVSLQSSTLFTGCPCDGANATNQLLAGAIQAAAQAGIVTVVASGNNTQCDRMASPACISGAIAVAGVRIAGVPDQISTTTNLSPCIDLAAPGVQILSTGLAGGTLSLSGTSQAAPHVSALLALMADRRPGIPATLFPGLIRATGVPTTAGCTPPFPLPPRIDALAAVQRLNGAARR